MNDRVSAGIRAGRYAFITGLISLLYEGKMVTEQYKRVIICAGLNRSGSTWQLNAARIILKLASPDMDIYVSWISDYDPENVAPIHLVKVHRYGDAAALARSTVLSAYRDLRAVAGSLVRMGWATTQWDNLKDQLDIYVEDCAAWETCADLVTPYEVLLEDPLGVIGDIARVLDIDLGPERQAAVHQIMAEVEPAIAEPTGNLASADPLTFFHNGHIGDRLNEIAASRLPDPVLARLEIHYRHWLIAHHYSIPVERLAAYAEEISSEFSQFKDGSLTILQLDDTAYLFKHDSEGKRITLSGFDIEEWGAWSVKPLCSLIFQLPANVQAGEIVLRAGAFTPAGSAPLVATAFLNGEKVDQWLWRSGIDHQILRIPFGPSARRSVLSFLIDGARSARSLGLGPDDRELGIALVDVHIEPTPQAYLAVTKICPAIASAPADFVSNPQLVGYEAEA